MKPDIRIHWEGQWVIGEYFSLPADPVLRSTSMGVYQVVSSSRPAKPIYIGKTYEQSFSRRIPQHSKEELARWIDRNVRGRLHLKVGHLELKTWKRISKAMLDDVESLLVAAYEPVANSSKTMTYNGGEFCIENIGSRRPLSRWAWAKDVGDDTFDICTE